MEREEKNLMKYRKILVAAQVVLLVIACGFADKVFAARGAEKDGIKIIAPLDKAWVTQSQVYLAGSVTGASCAASVAQNLAVFSACAILPLRTTSRHGCGQRERDARRKGSHVGRVRGGQLLLPELPCGSPQ